MRDRALRAIAECKHLATMTEESGRITRRFLTPPVHDVHAHLRRRMVELGMDVRVDAVGNLRGLWNPPNAVGRRLVLGSHIDTVPDAGAYDGVLGVMLALEWVSLARQALLPLMIEVIAFSEEEGVRFGVPFIGSRAVAGRFDPAMLACRDPEGIRMDDAIRAFGLDPSTIDEAVIVGNARGFVEIHIEQGPVLDAGNLPLAVVSAIVGQTRLGLRFTGQANHAGTTPMNMRRDALAAAAKWITIVEKSVSQAALSDAPGLVATVGKIAVEPNAGNVIPGKVDLSLDLRHSSNQTRTSWAAQLLADARAAAQKRGVELASVQTLDEPAVEMDADLSLKLNLAVEAAGYPLKTMPSGAGHDAMVMATRLPAAMLFLRSPGGISHHPAEAVREQDVEAALQVGRIFLARVAADAS
jgi:allantoate deiminase